MMDFAEIWLAGRGTWVLWATQKLFKNIYKWARKGARKKFFSWKIFSKLKKKKLSEAIFFKLSQIEEHSRIYAHTKI